MLISVAGVMSMIDPASFWFNYLFTSRLQDKIEDTWSRSVSTEWLNREVSVDTFKGDWEISDRKFLSTRLQKHRGKTIRFKCTATGNTCLIH